MQVSNIGNVRSKWIVNLSSSLLSPAQVSLLSKGPNFALVLTNPPNVEFISAVKEAWHRLTDQDAQECRVEVNILIKRIKPPKKKNISREEKKALNELWEDQERMVLMADKGVAMVVIDRKEYQEKVKVLLVTSAYRTISTDPTNNLKVQLIQKLRRSKRETNRDEGMYRSMYTTSCTTQSFMGCLNPQNRYPLRPIVCSRGSVTYWVAKIIVRVFKPLVGKSPHHIQSNSDSISKVGRLLSFQENASIPTILLQCSSLVP